MIISPLEFRRRHAVPPLPAFALSPTDMEAMRPSTLSDPLAAFAGEHFRETFSGWSEGPTDAATIREHYLAIEAHDAARVGKSGILDDLGRADATITLGQYWYLLHSLGRQDRFTAYVQKADRIVSVQASWTFKGRQTAHRSMFVESSDVDKPYTRGAGCYILSR